MTDTAELSTPAYIQYRVKRDLNGAAAWLAAKWRASIWYKLLVLAVLGVLAVWVAVFVWLASDLPDAETLLVYETPLPTVVRGADGEIVHNYARERRVQLQYEDFPEKLKQAYISAEDKTFYSHGGVDFTG
ncbi:MAG: transglycosylase domain-containing protein, partial [Pseudomonadota bacterium]|nr:transglycosylase domain-containing protein [Pseudomonadota bacterium]